VSAHDGIRAEIEGREREVATALREELDRGGRLVIVKAPPGSGKTHTLLKTAAYACERGLSIAIGAQTNAQANDICRRIARDYPTVHAFRFAAGGSEPEHLGRNVTWVTETAALPAGQRCVVVATVAKWGMVNLGTPFDLLLVDEAWQMKWADFMLCGQVSDRFVLIGDPGQIPPVVPIDSSRWETSERPPHFPTPEVILRDPELRSRGRVLELPASRRLPHDSVELIQPFYDFRFHAWAGPGERSVQSGVKRGDGVDRAIALLAAGSAVVVTIPTPDEGPPLEKDEDLARTAANLVKRLLDHEVRVRDDGKEHKLAAEAIGISATHRVMNTALYLALPGTLRGRVVVDTPERWQGLERDVMIAVHPLSGVVRPSEFDLETGRLCVMTSRHRAGLIIMSRDHVGDTLARTIPSAEQAVGRPDVAGRGHKIHSGLWATLSREARIVRA